MAKLRVLLADDPSPSGYRSSTTIGRGGQWDQAARMIQLRNSSQTPRQTSLAPFGASFV